MSLTSAAASVCLFACLLISPPSLRADDLQLDRGSNALYQQLLQLQTTGSVLHVVAHPDDEDGGMLAYAARGLGARTMLFSITRGEGGANMISSHFFDQLGALRTLEHTRAAQYYGIELFYSRAADYGYSKTLEEAMGKWQRGRPILADLVAVIRRQRPTVLVSRFVGDRRDGHGQHQMAGVLSRLAFEAAADPQQFPEQIQQGLRPWQVKKLYVRAGSPWRREPPKQWSVKLPTGQYDPVIGATYAQIARFGLGFQRSQGITGHASDAGPRDSYYRLTKSATGEQGDLADAGSEEEEEGEVSRREDSLFSDLSVDLPSWCQGVTGLSPAAHAQLQQVGDAIGQLLDAWRPTHPADLVPRLTTALDQLRTCQLAAEQQIGQSYTGSDLQSQLNRMERGLQRAVLLAAGVEVHAWANRAGTEQAPNHVVPGAELQVQLHVSNPGDQPLDAQLAVDAPTQQLTLPAATVPAAATYQGDTALQISPEAPVTRPHWHRESLSRPLYDVQPDGRQRALPAAPITATARLRFGETWVSHTVPVQTRWRHPEYGNVRYPLTIVPALSVRFALDQGLIRKTNSQQQGQEKGDAPAAGESKYVLPVIVRNNLSAAALQAQSATATVRLELPPGLRCEPAERQLTFSREGDEQTVEFTLQVTPQRQTASQNTPAPTTAQPHTIRAVAELAGQTYSEGFQTVTARDLDRVNTYAEAVHRVSVADVRVAGSPRIGYIPGSGDQVAQSLGALGLEPVTLSAADLAGGDLGEFDVILVGVRAYAVRTDIRQYNARLLDYVRRGGVLVVQYQTPEFDQNFGPYPYEMGRGPEEVSEEDAAVTILAPEHPLMTFPNRITAADFNGWFEQRGSKFWRSWDDHYTALLECHDRGQAPQRGGMLVAPFGRGVYVYSAYAWYRQLPQGVPGAYRLFANMLSLPESTLVQPAAAKP